MKYRVRWRPVHEACWRVGEPLHGYRAVQMARMIRAMFNDADLPPDRQRLVVEIIPATETGRHP